MGNVLKIREGSEGSSHQQAEKWEMFVKIREGSEGSSHQQAEKWENVCEN